MVEVGEGRGWGGMASVASEADRSLAKVCIAILAGCLLPGGGTFWLEDIEGKKVPLEDRGEVGWGGREKEELKEGL